jgi:hypothetical protein
MDQHIHSDGQTLSLSHLAKKLSHVSANLCYDQENRWFPTWQISISQDNPFKNS